MPDEDVATGLESLACEVYDEPGAAAPAELASLLVLRK
jgi:hypothetical protein